MVVAKFRGANKKILLRLSMTNAIVEINSGRELYTYSFSPATYSADWNSRLSPHLTFKHSKAIEYRFSSLSNEQPLLKHSHAGLYQKITPRETESGGQHLRPPFGCRYWPDGESPQVRRGMETIPQPRAIQSAKKPRYRASFSKRILGLEKRRKLLLCWMR